MNDTKNLLLAWISSTSTIFAAFDGGEWVATVSAVVLPILFFAIGKTIDVALQFHFKRRERERDRDTGRR